METITPIILGIVALLAILAVAMVFLRKRRAERLRSQFGPEYERAVEAAGDRHKAIAELHQRQKRVRRFAIKSLTPEERDHYTPLWTDVQTQFVEDPKAAVAEADHLLADVMTRRGYPAADFEQRYADLSVDHPVAVQGYRTAHDIAVRESQGEANTEDLRQAVLCYRTLFRELVGQPAAEEPVIEEQTEPADVSASETQTEPVEVAENQEPAEPAEVSPNEEPTEQVEVSPNEEPTEQVEASTNQEPTEPEVSANEEPTLTEAASTAEDADEDVTDESMPTVDPVLAEKPANVSEPMRT